MIFDELFDFREYLENNTKVIVHIGDPDTGADELPCIKLLFETEFNNYRHSEKLTAIDLPVSIKIITTKGDERKGLELLDKVTRKANQFNDHKGHELAGTGSPEYVDETKTFEITVLYTLKLMEQDS